MHPGCMARNKGCLHARLDAPPRSPALHAFDRRGGVQLPLAPAASESLCIAQLHQLLAVEEVAGRAAAPVLNQNLRQRSMKQHPE